MAENVTEILIKASDGSEDAYNRLFFVVYDQLKNIAEQQMNYENPDHTFSRTDLVHEVFIKMVDKNRIDWKNRTHFYGVAAICMKQLLVDYARKKLAQKRGGDYSRQTYIDELIPAASEAKKIITLDSSLKKLEEFDQRMAQVVDYRFFGGLTIKETAELLNVSANTVKRDWAKARGFLLKELEQEL
ncbi:ECF-type sigma factor [Rhodohalobacter sp. 614A]|uniref:ECF-type sigma factor n=1 Tax=Rhodohalobacter sp. 614A TaxID=2908649 RepID=UPI001F2D639E|nr:ECF-type sigma factor [Rhodohalobacter sp. 614A]